MAAHRFLRNNLRRSQALGVLFQPLQTEQLCANRFFNVVKRRDQWAIRFHSKSSTGLKEVPAVHDSSFPFYCEDTRPRDWLPPVNYSLMA